MFEHLLLICAIILGMAVLRLLRRLEPGQRGYLFLVIGELVGALVAMSRADRFLGAAVIGFAVLTVAIPWVLEGMSRRAFTRGQLSWAVRLAGLRSTLMPGAGLSRQQQVLHGLALLERQGVDAALQHFRELVGEVEDGGELAVIHEQIVSMLFYDQRWSEGIAHFEGQFHLGYAAMRPALALGLLRAYGEAGRLDNAAGLLRALEDGPLGADPGAAELLGQARLTFLAYAGASSYVDEAVGGHCKSLGLSKASGALFRGIALARAGQPDKAKSELQRVQALAGPSDERVVKASSRTLESLREAGDQLAEVEPELRRYAHAVGERLRSFLQTERLPRTHRAVYVTHFVAVALGLGYLAAQLVGGGGLGIVRVGAYTQELWRAGSWGRLFTASFVQTDLIGLLLDIYAIWLGGHVIERLMGSARMVLVVLWGGAAGVLVGGLVSGAPAQIVCSGSMMATAVLVAALWTLLPARTPSLAARARRSLSFTLCLLLGAQLLESVPSELGVVIEPLALLAAALVGTVLAGLLPLTSSRTLRVVAGALAVASVGVGVGGLWQVAREDVESFALAHRDRSQEVRGVVLDAPRSFEVTDPEREVVPGLPLPIYPGLIDAQARRAGMVVQFVIHEPEGAEAEGAAAGADDDEPLLFAFDPELRRELDIRQDAKLPASFTARMQQAPAAAEGYRTYLLQRNGEVVARIVERPLPGDPRGRTALLIAAPESALDQAPVLYASMLAEARVSDATAESSESEESEESEDSEASEDVKGSEDAEDAKESSGE